MPVPLDETRGFAAYALLGDPGSGKSKAFEQEAAASGTEPISAGDFLGLDHPELQNASSPIFIDGLDEMRAGTSNGTLPLDGIRKKLQQLGCRRFRISCRAADWLGQPDVQRLQSMLPAGEQVQVFTLQPLTVADVAAILPSNHAITDPQAFIASAEQHGLTDLLFNPQTLGMLAAAVGPENRWPETRLAVYEMACERLVQEHNEEHVAATRKTAPDQGQLLRATAYLCAIQLIADLAGFTHSPNSSDRVLRLNAVPNSEGLPLGEALTSRLFKTVGRDVFAPVHRTVAEFLAARCLADRLQDKLTLRRVRALICGSDSGIVSGMRGLAGWLASTSSAARATFVRLDSLGVLLYGDARNFSIAEKSALMDRLGGDIAVSASFRWSEWEGRPFSTLVTSEMLPIVTQRMADTDRSENQQLLVLSLLEGLLHAPPATDLAPLLLSMVRDASRWQSVRLRALKIYRRCVGLHDASLRALLDDVGDGTVTDSDDEILGVLLASMYPRALSSADLPAFFHPRKNENLIGKYTAFWRRDLEQVDAAEVPRLLDAFAARTELRRDERMREYAKAIGALLVRALNEGADEIPDDRLLTWLDAACGKHSESLLENDSKQEVQRWLQARPQRYFALLHLALSRFASKQNRVWPAEARLHGARAPASEATWWLGQAEATDDEEQAKEYFVQALHAISDEPGPELEALLIACEHLAAARGWQDPLASRLTCSFEQYEWKRDEVAHRQERQREAAERRVFYRARLAEFALPLVPLAVLSSVAEVYEHRVYDIDGKTPKERLTNLFAGDEELVQAALTALRDTIGREDLPSVQETLVAAGEHKMMVLNLPALIGLELAYREDCAFLDSMSDDRLVAALVAHLVRSVEDHETWVATAVESRPQCMADALSVYMTGAMQWKDRTPHETHLFRDQAYAEVTKRCLLPLLARFPLRARTNLRGALMDMLHTALTLPVRDEMLQLIQARLDAPKVDGPQRACWLAAGLLLDPDHYLALANCYMLRRPPATQHLADFLHYRREVGGEGIPRPSNVLGFLIEQFAAACSPAQFIGVGWVSPEMNRAELIKRFINELAGRPETESTEQLRRLESLPALTEWGPKLREARAAQQVVRRDATYERPTWSQVCTALQQGAPSSPAEIAAVVNDTIEDLKDQVRHSDLNLNLEYWNADSHKKATKPRHEELCRNTFADQLRVRLERFAVGCLPETQHVDGKRSDLWCTVGLPGVPIEAKKDHHPDLWTATKGQLMARYASDPRAKGYGIYVVFWFGQPSSIPAPPFGVRPSTPQELEAMLEAGLTEDERRMITIHVIDCSVRQGKP